MSPWHVGLKLSSTLRAYFAGSADPVQQNTADKFSILERLLVGLLVFESTPALPILASSLETIVPGRLRGAQFIFFPDFSKLVYAMTRFMRLFACARPPRGACLRPNNSKDSVHGSYSYTTPSRPRSLMMYDPGIGYVGGVH
jgi:hypothetical protein